MDQVRRRLYDKKVQIQTLQYKNSQLEQQLAMGRPRQEPGTSGWPKAGRKRKMLPNPAHAPNPDGPFGLVEAGTEKPSAADGHTVHHHEQDARVHVSQVTEERPLKQRRLDDADVVQSLTVDVQECVTDDTVAESCEPGVRQKKSKGRKRG